ncbi:hypothetical protein C8J57DRAFT_1282132 [Mycena rebaudengoi]|nr:hypothetical protein C8J57DRAFT_1282132 [Mycena rebaudengoi]
MKTSSVIPVLAAVLVATSHISAVPVSVRHKRELCETPDEDSPVAKIFEKRDDAGRVGYSEQDVSSLWRTYCAKSARR